MTRAQRKLSLLVAIFCLFGVGLIYACMFEGPHSRLSGAMIPKLVLSLPLYFFGLWWLFKDSPIKGVLAQTRIDTAEQARIKKIEKNAKALDGATGTAVGTQPPRRL